MNTLDKTTDMSMVEIVTLLATDHLNTTPKNSMPKARCAPVMFADGSPILVIDAEQQDGDVYRLLDSIKPEPSVNYYAVITGGWAAPTDGNDLPPSVHPERKRVELLVLTSRDGQVASALSMEGKEILIDEGKAQGSLAEAVKNIFG